LCVQDTNQSNSVNSELTFSFPDNPVLDMHFFKMRHSSPLFDFKITFQSQMDSFWNHWNQRRTNELKIMMYGTNKEFIAQESTLKLSKSPLLISSSFTERTTSVYILRVTSWEMYRTSWQEEREQWRFAKQYVNSLTKIFYFLGFL
jgi:alpha-L-arabinofuranosidase